MACGLALPFFMGIYFTPVRLWFYVPVTGGLLGYINAIDGFPKDPPPV